MTARIEALYQLCITRVIDVCRDRLGRTPQPRVAISDFELAILRALAICFPTAYVRGCYYHFGTVSYNGSFFYTYSIDSM